MTTPRSRARSVLSVALAPVLMSGLLALAGCTGSSARPDLTPAQTLAAAKRKLDRTSGVHVTMATKDLPPKVNGLVSADGVGTNDPAFSGSIRVASSGLSVRVPVVAVNGSVWARLPFRTSFDKIDPNDYAAPDPARLMDDQAGLSSLLTAAQSVDQGKRTRHAGTTSTTYTATIPGDAVAGVIPSASTDADFDARFSLDDRHRLTRAVLTGPFYPKAPEVSYTITLDAYGTHKEITPP